MFALSMELHDNAFFGSMYWSILLQFSMALTSGHFTTSCYSIAPLRVPEETRKSTGFIMVMFLLFGLTYGGFITLLVNN
jgi:hypothetical protein